MPFEDPAVVVSRPRSPGRRYLLADGTRVPSVTQVLQVVAKPALIQWANRIGLQGINADEYRDERAAIGTAAHALAEHHLRGVTADIAPDLRARATPAFQNWLRWLAQHTVNPVLMETPFVSETYKYGGTPDLVAEMDGVVELIDFKFTNSIHADQFHQLAGYRRLLEENGYPVERVRIVRIDRELGRRTPYDERVLEDTADHWAVFRAALALYRAQAAFRR